MTETTLAQILQFIPEPENNKVLNLDYRAIVMYEGGWQDLLPWFGFN